MYQFVLLHSCYWLKKTSIKRNGATDEGNSRNEIRDLTKDEIGVAGQSWV